MILFKNRLVFLLLYLVQPVWASESPVTFVVLNSATGHSISSYEVMLENVNGRHSISGKDFRTQTQHLKEGIWQVAVHAPGFESMASHISVNAGASSRIEFHLDPVVMSKELQPENVISFHRPDATLVLGFVADDETRRPLSDVTIRANGGTVKTDASGFYRIYLPLASNAGTPRIEFQRAGFQTEVRENFETWSNGDWICNISLKQGNATNTIDLSKAAHQESESAACENCDASNPTAPDNFATGVIIPASIRVGRNCTGTSCTTVQVYSVQTYTKFVLPAEWYSCWGSLGNGMNSLMAGAVAIRSYGLWYVYHPLSSTYDICDNTFCQAFGSVQSTNANNAVDATDRYLMTDFSQTNVMRSEYSAENNNKGCGDGYTGTGTSWPCIADFVCQTQTPNGHGRGVCQWGTIRWANGTRVSTASPCAQGVPHGLGTKPWQEILSHYYPSYSLIQGSTATLLSAAPESTLVRPGTTFTIRCTLRTTDDMVLMISAAVAPAGTTTYTYDPAHDVKLSFFAGDFQASRQFTAPQVPWGPYDMLLSLWHDTNNSNTVDQGDLLLNSQLYPNAFTISNPNSVEEQLPAAFRLYQNYPNPFNPETEIQFSVGTFGQASLRVFDLLGREVATLFNDNAEPGRTYSLKLNGENLASGVYMYKLSSGTVSDMKRLVLVR